MDVSIKQGITRISPFVMNPVIHSGYKKRGLDIPATRKRQSVVKVLNDDSSTVPFCDTS